MRKRGEINIKYKPYFIFKKKKKRKNQNFFKEFNLRNLNVADALPPKVHHDDIICCARWFSDWFWRRSRDSPPWFLQQEWKKVSIQFYITRNICVMDWLFSKVKVFSFYETFFFFNSPSSDSRPDLDRQNYGNYSTLHRFSPPPHTHPFSSENSKPVLLFSLF